MKISKLFRILGSILLLVTSLSGYQAFASNPFTVTVRGLEPGDKATLSLTSMAPDTDVIFEQTVVGEEKGELTITVAQDLKDGNYELGLTAPEKYFRDPKAYWFKVYQSNMVNPGNKPIVFNLIPPSARNYTPYRQNDLSSGPSDNLTSKPTYRIEMAIMLSAPPKQLQTSDTLLSAGVHHAGPYTLFDGDGVWGRYTVVNPGVRHNIQGTEFVAARAMAAYNTSQNETYMSWMELGWAEVSWDSDTRYMYHFDSHDRTWYTSSLPTGTTLEVRVSHQGSNVWLSEYLDGSTWVQVRSNDIGFSTPDQFENVIEVYTYDGTHPSLPQANVDNGKLSSSGEWSVWNTYYTTYTSDGSPYHTHYNTQYYDFYVHQD